MFSAMRNCLVEQQFVLGLQEALDVEFDWGIGRWELRWVLKLATAPCNCWLVLSSAGKDKQ